MPYQLWVKDEAKAEILHLPGHIRQRIRQAVRDLATKPRPHYSKQLDLPEGSQLEVWRLRLDDWRVIYVIDEEWSEVGVLAVRKRPPYDYADLPELLKEL